MKQFLIATCVVFYAFAAHATVTDSEREALKTYCEPDIERLCKGVGLGGGKMKACLEKNQNELSVGCAKALKELKGS